MELPQNNGPYEGCEPSIWDCDFSFRKNYYSSAIETDLSPRLNLIEKIEKHTYSDKCKFGFSCCEKCHYKESKNCPMCKAIIEVYFSEERLCILCPANGGRCQQVIHYWRPIKEN